MEFYSHRSAEEQAQRLPTDVREKYLTTQLDRIEIDGEEIYGYFEYSFLEEKSYVEQPVRATDGSIRDINNYATFLTPRLIIKYNMMHIDDYRKLMKLLKSKNSFSVTCYDIVEDKRVTHEMYFAPPSMPIIYQQYLMALGVQEYTIELIGTNNVNTVKVTFHINYGDLDWFTVYTVNKHEPFKIPEVLWVDDSGNEFGQDDYGTVSYWNTNPMDVASKYYRDKSYYFSTDTDLYAIR